MLKKIKLILTGIMHISIQMEPLVTSQINLGKLR